MPLLLHYHPIIAVLFVIIAIFMLAVQRLMGQNVHPLLYRISCCTNNNCSLIRLPLTLCVTVLCSLFILHVNVLLLQLLPRHGSGCAPCQKVKYNTHFYIHNNNNKYFYVAAVIASTLPF